MKPTIGRIVLYHCGPQDSFSSDQPLAAIITYVHSDNCVNMTIFDRDGTQKARNSVLLVHYDDDQKPATNEGYAEWKIADISQLSLSVRI